jgi:osmoprotectant transport system permease protein
MYRAVADGDIDVTSAFSSDGRIASFDLVVLEDPRGAIPPYDAVLLIAPARANDAAFIAALEPLVGAIDVAAMRRANGAGGGSGIGLAARWFAVDPP